MASAALVPPSPSPPAGFFEHTAARGGMNPASGWQILTFAQISRMEEHHGQAAEPKRVQVRQEKGGDAARPSDKSFPSLLAQLCS